VSPNSAPVVKRALVIVNPGARRAEQSGIEALHAFAELSIPCDVVFTTAPGHATELAHERARDVDAVFTIGGDGTAMEVVTALAGGGPPVGILPGGTGNVIVHSLGIPYNTRKAVHALVHGVETRLDLGRLDDGRHFAIGVGVGLDEAMIAGASRVLKKRVGVAAYVWSATKAFGKLERFRVKLTVDGVTHEREATSVLIANLGSVLGGALRLGPGIVPNDGLLEACIFSPETHGDAIRIFLGMLRGTAHLDDNTFYTSGRHFRLETDPRRRAQADGELLDMTPLEVTVEPAAARLLVPKP
jgi:YegS/Rv2252/BmrU family lipid kinase